MNIEAIEELTPIQATILRLWDSGMSSRKIGAEIGKSKSAVLGALYRMRENGIPMRRPEVEVAKKVLAEAIGGPKAKTFRKKPQAYHKPKDLSPRITLGYLTLDHEKKAPKDIFIAPVRGDEITISKLSRFKCRYINGEIDGANTLYCGRKVERGSYCAEHAALCYYVPADR